MNIKKTLSYAVTSSVLLCGAAFASQGPVAKPTPAKPAVVQPITMQSGFQHWLIRVRGLYVVPDTSSSTISGLGGHVTDISKTVLPELDFTYFFTPHLAAELILGTSIDNKVTATGTAIGTVNLGKVSLLPPTLTAQWHFLPNDKLDPYVGAGINYTIFYNVDSGPTATSIDYDNAFGAALQAGLDYNVDSHWSFNVDVKKIFLRTDVTVHVNTAAYHTRVTIDPWIFGVGMGYRF